MFQLVKHSFCHKVKMFFFWGELGLYYDFLERADSKALRPPPKLVPLSWTGPEEIYKAGSGGLLWSA